jgi:DNA-binding ferritin-like protein
MDALNCVLTQTTYDIETAEQLLKEFNNDYMKVIKQYHGICEQPDRKLKSVNQEIYTQIRKKLSLTP